MTPTATPKQEDALRASALRHPSGLRRPGCHACGADGIGGFTPCATHSVEALCRTYVGTPGNGAGNVCVVEQVLTTGEVLATWTLAKRTADGDFAWGYSGHGPVRLAAAILSDALGAAASVETVLAYRTDVIANLPGDEGFGLSKVSVLAWVYDHRGHKGGSAVPA